MVNEIFILSRLEPTESPTPKGWATQSRRPPSGRGGDPRELPGAGRSPAGRRDGLPPMKPMAVEQAAGGVARRRSPKGRLRTGPTEARPTQWPVDEVAQRG